ncbi:hypothetical protein ACWD4T_33980 [Streptomyces umbrinus]
MQTPDAFRSAHGDFTTWSPADFDNYEYALEAANPGFQEAVATGRFVLGRRRASGGEVVVELRTAEELAQHIPAGPHRLPFIGGTSRSGKTSYAAVLEQMQRITG